MDFWRASSIYAMLISLKFRFARRNWWCRELWFHFCTFSSASRLSQFACWDTFVSRVYCFRKINYSSCLQIDKKFTIKVFVFLSLLIKPVFASWRILWSIASLLLLVVDFIVVLAAQLTRIIAIDAHVEVLTVGWMRISFILIATFRALESVLQLLNVLLTVFAIGRVRPGTVSGFLIEMQSISAFALSVLSILTCVENIANGLIRMREDSVLPWTIFVLAFRSLFRD